MNRLLSLLVTMSQMLCVSIVAYYFVISSFCEAIRVYPRILEGKIVGGHHTVISNFPHAVFLQIQCGTVNMICGATVINQQILLTAGHCLPSCQTKYVIDAYAGHENLEKVTITRKVSRTATHGGFSRETLSNDIALLLLSQKMPLGSRLTRVIIKPKHSTTLTATVAGWGVIDDVTRERPLTLKMVEQSLQPPSICASLGNLHAGMMCAGDYKNEDNRPSRGDSGSALITSDYQQIGLVSYRYDDYRGLLVYTNVSYYYDWIKQSSRRLFCPKFSL